MKTAKSNIDAERLGVPPPATCSEVEIKNAPCWCGEESPEYADEDDGLESRCGGTGHLNCFCGGDLCCCHNHGQAECYGCPDCQKEDDDDYYDE